MKYAMPFGKNWRFGFAFKDKDGDVITVTDAVATSADESVGKLSIVDNGTRCLIDSGKPGSTSGKISSASAKDAAGNPLEVNFTFEVAPEPPDHVDLDAGAVEDKTPPADAGADQGATA